VPLSSLASRASWRGGARGTTGRADLARRVDTALGGAGAVAPELIRYWHALGSPLWRSRHVLDHRTGNAQLARRTSGPGRWKTGNAASPEPGETVTGRRRTEKSARRGPVVWGRVGIATFRTHRRGRRPGRLITPETRRVPTNDGYLGSSRNSRVSAEEDAPRLIEAANGHALPMEADGRFFAPRGPALTPPTSGLVRSCSARTSRTRSKRTSPRVMPLNCAARHTRARDSVLRAWVYEPREMLPPSNGRTAPGAVDYAREGSSGDRGRPARGRCSR